jgi:hypothetical protein
MPNPEDLRVQKVASVAPATVTQVSRQVLEPVKRKYNRRKSAPAPELHTHIKWPPERWAELVAAVRPGERWVLDSATEAHTEYIR